MEFENKKLRDVADVAARIMMGEKALHPNQQKLDVHEPEKDELTSKDFEMLRNKKKVKEGREFTEKLLETVRKSDVPAFLRKAKGDTPLTMADVKAPKKDSISAPENLAKARNETYDVSKIAPKPFKSEPKFERNPFKGDHDSLKSNLKRPKLTTGLRQSKISPGETELYIKNSYEPSDAPENLAKARNEEVMNEMDKSQPSQERHGDYPLGSPTGTPAKPVETKKVVKDLTKLLNKSFNKEEVEQIDEKDAPEHIAVKPLVHIRKPQTEPAALIHRNPTYPGVKRPGTSSDDTNMVRKEEVEHLNEDDFAHAKKQGWSVSQHYHHTKVTHPKHGIVSVDRYGEWMHHPDQDYLGRPKGDLIAHGQFDKLNKHLSSLKEEVELHESLMGHIEVKPARKHKDPEILAVHDVHYKGKKIGDIEVYHHRSGMKYGSSHDATGNSTAGHRTMDQAIDDIRQEHAQHLKSMKEEVEHLNEDDFAHAKKQGWSVSQHYHHTKVTHPKHGIISVDRYGEWHHHPEQDWVGRPKGDLVAHGQFDKLNKHLSSLKEETELDEENYKQCDDAPITTDTLAGRIPGGKINSFKSYKVKVSPLDKEGERKPDDDTPEAVKIQKTPAMKSHEVHEATIAGTSGWEPIKKDTKDKSGAVHTPMSRARDLAKSALKRVQDKTKIK